jgi:hypothetical protein
MRAFRAGMKTVFVPDIEVRHFSRKPLVCRRLRLAVTESYSFTMTLFRYLPIATASLFSLRLLAAYMWHRSVDHKTGLLLLPFATMWGAARGLAGRQLLDAEGVEFYSSATTRPKYGNVPLWDSVREVHRRARNEGSLESDDKT